MEEWKSIKGYKDLYEVSNLGDVRSLDRIIVYKGGRECSHKGRLLKPTINSAGYEEITLSKDGNHKNIKVHQLVAYHFCDGYLTGLVVDHMDADKRNNCSTNLEWVTRGENTKRAYKLGLFNEDHLLKYTESKKIPVKAVHEETGEVLTFDCMKASTKDPRFSTHVRNALREGFVYKGYKWYRGN